MASNSMPAKAAWGAAICVAACIGATCAAAQTDPAKAPNANGTPILTAHFAGNRNFLWPGVPLEYLVIASDKEDGDTLSGGIDPARVGVAFEYAADGKPSAPAEPVSPKLLKLRSDGRRLIAASDCNLCHAVSGDRPVPSYAAIAEFHGGGAEAAVKLAAKIISGGSGVWGATRMPPHPETSSADALAMARYVLSLSKPEARRTLLAIRGTIEADRGMATGPFGSLGAGRYLLMASYTDRGGPGAPRTGRLVVPFRAPVLLATERNASRNIRDVSDEPAPRFAVPSASPAIIGYDGIDMTGVRSLSIIVGNDRDAWPGGRIVARLRSPDGPVVGRAIVAPDGGAESTKSVPIAIPPTHGVHSLFLVLRGSVAVAAVRFER